MKRFVLFSVVVALAAGMAWGAEPAASPPSGKGWEGFTAKGSRLVGRVEYLREKGEMRVQLAGSSDWYVYEGVPGEVYDGFAGSKSKGSFYTQKVQGRYHGRREE